MSHSYKITEESFYKYLKCPSWLIHEQQDADNGHKSLIRLLQKEGLLEEHAERLIEKKSVSRIKLDDIDEAFTQTIELMREGKQTIYGAVLIYDNFIAQPDLLEKVEGKSDLGDYYYVASDLKRSSRLKDEYKFEACFYADILEKVQGHRPIQGYIIHQNGEVSNFILDEFLDQYHELLEKIEHLLETGEYDPFLTSACKQSPFFHKCVEEAEKCRDLSLINRIWRSEVDAIKSININTIDDLANASIESLKEIPELTLDRIYFLQQQAISLVENKVILTSEIEFEENETTLVIDIESDPFHDIHYLFGVLIIENGQETYKTFLAETPADEEENWHNFTNFLRDYPDTPIYHYGWYEVDVFRRLVNKYETSPIARELFENYMVDLLTVLRNKVIFPSPFYSLKDIAKFLGFNWRTSDASGIDSIVWYHEWQENQDSDKLQKIIDYNEDDVRATWFLRNWAKNEYEKRKL